MQKADRKPVKTKGAGKGSGKSNGKQAPKEETPAKSVSDPVIDRVAVLEAKFNTLEKRTDSIDAKVTDGFLGIQDQLRQVLQAVNARPPPVEVPTGFTPPPKKQHT